MIIIYIYYQIFMSLYILLVFFLLILHFELHYNVQASLLHKAFPWTGKNLRKSQPIN